MQIGLGIRRCVLLSLTRFIRLSILSMRRRLVGKGRSAFCSYLGSLMPKNLMQCMNGLKVKEQEEEEVRLSKLRPAIRNMLKGNLSVFHYSTFKTADRLFAQHTI